MTKYVVARLLRSIVTIFAVISIVFLLLRLMPISGYFEPGTYERLPESARITRLHALGLSDMQGNMIHPLVQLGNYYKNLFTKLDLGVSLGISQNTPVLEIIAQKAPYSVVLGVISTLISLLLGWTCGLFAARYKNKAFDKFIIVYGAIVSALPSIILILILQIYITAWTGWPMIMKQGQLNSWYTPIIILVLTSFAGDALWLRRYTVDQINSDYVKLAYAKGLPSNKVFFGHILRNAFTPMAYSLPAAFILTISGSLLIENAFGIPGMGRFFLMAITRRDNNVVQGIVFVYVVLGIFSVFLGDMLAAFVDPRIRLTSSAATARPDETDLAGGADNG
ncbi:MAG: ABC transporter permease [Clostridiales bacterium]|jgi:oligopeptide transport system permease protein|nr:ABC transporter permease [Clostridiales bacterium]